MTTSNLFTDLQRDEGFRPAAYPDPISHGAPWTIGYGHTGREVHPGLVWTKTTALAALTSDISATERGLDSALPWWRTLDDIRQDAVANQAFNLGVHRFMGFNTYLELLKAHQFDEAAEDDLHTLWGHQVGARAVRIAQEIRTGQHV